MQTTHSTGIIPVSLSKLLERFGFYGIRSILILYMIKQLGYGAGTANSTYALFVGITGFTPLLGGLIGDLLINSKLTAIIGGFIQAIGCFVLLVPGTLGVYAGMFLIAFGSGLYSPNIVSTLYAVYKTREEKLDAAMLIFYAAINVGAILAPLIVVRISDAAGYQIGFIIAGVLLAGSAVTLLAFGPVLTEVPAVANIHLQEKKKETDSGLRIIITIATLVCVPVFWVIYELINTPVYGEMGRYGASAQWFYYTSLYLNPITTIIGGIILALIFSFAQMSSLLKMVIGFAIYGISCVIVGTFGQSELSGNFAYIILFGLFLQAVGELFISPIALSVICKHGSAKFNSTLIGGYFTANTLFYSISSLVTAHFMDFGTLTRVILSVGVMVIFVVVFLVLYLVSRKDHLTVNG